jgi:hypothetical protein
MSKYKKLSLTFPFNHDIDFWFDCVGGPIEPVFNKDGYYLEIIDKKTSRTWIEKNGEAYLYDTRAYFEYQVLTNEGNNLLDKDIMDALKLLIERRLASKEQRELYYFQDSREACRKTYRNARLHVLKSFKENRTPEEYQNYILRKV